MAFEVDEDILQDFLVEAGEILELLQEQLVELENNPDDRELLNAIFRGFHTVKGGAGFLALGHLVDACHGAENVFDTLRNGNRTVTSDLMDVILQALDTINAMFSDVQNRQEPNAADPELLEALHRLSEPESADEAPVVPSSSPTVEQNEPEPEPEPEPEESVTPTGDGKIGPVDEITQDEFDSLLDELHGAGKSPVVASPSPAAPTEQTKSKDKETDDITDDEFESLLDELHGKGKFSVEGPAEASPKKTAPDADKKAKSAGGDDIITDDEFERLLDELHGAGHAPGETAAPKEKSPAAKAEPAKTEAKTSAALQPAAAKPQLQPQSQSQPHKAEPAHAAEAKPAPQARQQQASHTAETTVRVDTSRLDQIMNMVGELVLVRNRLLSLSTSQADEEISKTIANLDLVTADLQGAVMKTRMQPIKKVFGRFPRVVRDLARSLKKEIKLELIGEETDLDKNLVEALADPLVHLVRNSVDHGIEMPDVREQAGKPRQGTVTLAASQEGDHILLTISDDGAGMDAERLKQIAVDRGLMDSDAAARLTDAEAYNLIFAPGFSTKKEISDISGRGVGMDVVKTKISQLNGSVHIDSQQGRGTVLEIKVPLTLAILPTLMVVVGKQIFALPLSTVSEIFHLDLRQTNIVDGQLTVIVRNKAVPLFYLEHWLLRNSDRNSRKEMGHVVILQIGTKQVGFVVDGLIGQEEVVIKPLGQMLHGTPGMAGATITSDGSIALILDVPNLLKHYARRL